MSGFQEIQFPLDVGFGASGGPERRTDIVTLSSGFEERNARWANSRRSYDAGLGIRSFKDLQTISAFFEQCRGRLHGFRFSDPFDHASCAAGAQPAATDQVIGKGDGTQKEFQLKKRYGGSAQLPGQSYERVITKPIADTVLVAIDGVTTTAFALDASTGKLTFNSAPATNANITAGFRFDVPVRFDTDRLEFSLAAFEAGDIPSIPLVELRI